MVGSYIQDNCALLDWALLADGLSQRIHHTYLLVASLEGLQMLEQKMQHAVAVSVFRVSTGLLLR